MERQCQWGFWWISPLVGMFVCLAFLVMALRFMSTGRGLMCMGGHQDIANHETAAMRREIDALHEEVKPLKAAR